VFFLERCMIMETWIYFYVRFQFRPPKTSKVKEGMKNALYPPSLVTQEPYRCHSLRIDYLTKSCWISNINNISDVIQLHSCSQNRALSSLFNMCSYRRNIRNDLFVSAINEHEFQQIMKKWKEQTCRIWEFRREPAHRSSHPQNSSKTTLI
jgi:hypothetical protein